MRPRATSPHGASFLAPLLPGSAGEARGRQLLRAALEADAEGLSCLLRLRLEGDRGHDPVDADLHLRGVDANLEAGPRVRGGEGLDLLAVDLEDDLGDVLTRDASVEGTR